MNTAFLSLGSNLGQRELYLQKIHQQITDAGIRILQKSSIIETDAWGLDSLHNKYLNQIIQIETTLYPFGLLRILQEIELFLGRTGKGLLQERTADIDIIFFNDWIISSQQLQIPHKRFAERLFVLEPMHEIAPSWTDPLSKESISSIYQKCLKANS